VIVGRLFRHDRPPGWERPHLHLFSPPTDARRRHRAASQKQAALRREVGSPSTSNPLHACLLDGWRGGAAAPPLTRPSTSSLPRGRRRVKSSMGIA